eukprot:COSAG02_NODE_173_length_31245_cov_413.548096_23_plen_133_part_00
MQRARASTDIRIAPSSTSSLEGAAAGIVARAVDKKREMVRGDIRALCLTLLVRQTTGHGAVVFPPPRNAVDSDVLPWSGPVPSDPPGVESATGWCPVWSEQEGKISGQNGQACFWVRGRPASSTNRLPLDHS